MARHLFFALALALLATTGCTFDSSSLSQRPPCETDSDCEQGVCVEGSCWDGTSIGDEDADASVDVPGDVGSDIDTGVDGTDPDGGDGLVCEPGEATCEGNIARVCNDDGSDWVETDCTGDCADCVCDSGACVPADCEPGQRACSGDTVLECNDLGEGWDEVEECGGDAECIGGVCVGECEPGALSCAGDELLGCNAERQATIQASCPDSDAWCSDEGGAHCEPWLCTPRSTRCGDEATTVERCSARGNAWTDGEPCGEDLVCNDGECIELDCEPGEVTCTGPSTYATCEEDGSASIISTCPEATYCSENGDGTISCLDQSCDPGDRRCVEGDEIVEVCDDRGTGFSITIECDDTDYCREGICTMQTCEPGSTRCVGDFAFLTCDDRGAAQVMTTCEAGTYCADAGGVVECIDQVCTPGERRCVSPSEVELCNTAGSGFTDTEICDELYACDTGVCSPQICEPNTFECTGNFAFQTCNALGTRWSRESCPAATYCSSEDDECAAQVCEPESVRCEEGDVYECNATGSDRALSEACSYGCTDGVCNPPICGDGVVASEAGEECDDGNDDPCDGCDACQRANGLQIGASTQTTSAVVWQPNNLDFTYEAWVRVTAGGALFGLGERSGSDYAWVGVESGRVVFEYATGTGSVARVTGGTTITGGWHHVAVERFDLWGAAIFVDGRLDAFSHVPLSGQSIDIPTPIWLGSDGTTTPATGVIDQVRLALKRRYTFDFNPPRQMVPDGTTVAFYDFDGADPGTVVDTSAGGRTLTITSAFRTPEACYGATPTSWDCGDGTAASWEQCDDGNVAGGDGCGVNCVTEVCRASERLGPSGHCYFVDNSGRDWGDARDNCDDRGDGSKFVTINDEVENDWITYFLDLTSAYWIGLTDDGLGNEGTYRWVRGGSDYRNWAEGEPNNNTSDWGDEDCVQIFGTDAGANVDRWNDAACSRDFRSICERQ